MLTEQMSAYYEPDTILGVEKAVTHWAKSLLQGVYLPFESFVWNPTVAIAGFLWIKDLLYTPDPKMLSQHSQSPKVLPVRKIHHPRHCSQFKTKQILLLLFHKYFYFPSLYSNPVSISWNSTIQRSTGMIHISFTWIMYFFKFLKPVLESFFLSHSLTHQITFQTFSSLNYFALYYTWLCSWLFVSFFPTSIEISLKTGTTYYSLIIEIITLCTWNGASSVLN